MSWFKSQPAKKHALHITASVNYDTASAQTVSVNSDTPLSIVSDTADIELYIRIKDFVGSADHASNSTTSPYFDERKDANISIQVNLKPKVDINGDELLFGNDFGYCIRDFLPYGTSTGLKLFKSWVDPSVEGDLYSEDPYLYGRALSSFNNIDTSNSKDGITIEENLGLDGIPEKNTDRQKYFQDINHLKSFQFKKDKIFKFDFFSGLVSLKNSDFNINLPGGYALNLSNYLNDRFNRVRYVLKKNSGDEMGPGFGESLLVINFDLAPLDEDNERLDDNKEEEITNDDVE